MQAVAMLDQKYLDVTLEKKPKQMENNFKATRNTKDK